MSWRVRHATADDAEAVEKLWHEMEALHAKPGMISNYESVPPIPEADGEAMLVALDDSDAVCGFHHLRMLDAHRVCDNAIVVSERVRGKNCGRALMEAGDKWARERGATESFGNVWTGNIPSRALCLKVGYEVVSEVLWKRLVA
jgi:GNAT superfamily N-acetyltransferase